MQKNFMKKMVATVLTGALMVSVFVGSGVETKAAGEFTLKEVGKLNKFVSSTTIDPSGNYTILNTEIFSEAKCLSTLSGENLSSANQKYEEIVNQLVNQVNANEALVLVHIDASKNNLYYFAIMGGSPTPGTYKNPSWTHFEFDSDCDAYYLYGTYANNSTVPVYVVVESGSTTDSSSVTSSNSRSGSSSAPTHTHSYSWTVVTEATEGGDGLELYQCSCGDVQARSVIPASQAYVSKFRDYVKNAPANGTVTYDSKMNHTFSDYIIKRLAERTDVTTVIDFKFENVNYTMTIPAGVDYTSFFTDEEGFYGYFCFAQLTGATIVEK